jgi:23S rRNA (cytidine1920-2'-O)/16S rRNA (cytidine1409-2'-O)-methyltransferase
MARRRRLDVELASRGLFPDVDSAMRAVLAGDISTEGRRLDHPGEQVGSDTVLHVRAHDRYVSRGGEKLEGGLQAFKIDPCGLRCLDVGCSTGGFTDCLLRHGASHVVAVDVGRAQFSWELRCNPRVKLLERTNIVDIATPEYASTIDFAVCDVSFTSVRVVLPAVMCLLKPTGSFLTLVKPQFEAAREDVGAGGIVRDEAVRQAALENIATAFRQAGLTVRGSCVSPIKGHKGNVEYLLYGVCG